MHEECKLTRLIQASNSVLMMIRDTRAAHNQVLTCLAFEQAFLQIPKEEEDPVRYVLMLIPNVYKLSIVLYISVATHGHTPSTYIGMNHPSSHPH
jgi:hypothetical protein